MQHRNIELKDMMSMPDDFEIVKVQTVTGVGGIIPVGSVFRISAKAAQNSGFGSLSVNTTYLADVEYTMIADDVAVIIGVHGNFSAIQIVAATTFANNATDIIVNGAGKNLSLLGKLPAGTILYGLFNRVSLQAANTDPIIIVYK